MEQQSRYLFIVAGPPACGKSTVARALAEYFGDAVYLDKDDLTELCRCAFDCGGVPFDRDAAFYAQHVRDAEYATLNHLACVNAGYQSRVIVNAPYIAQVRTPGYMRELKQRANAAGAKLALIWVSVAPEVCKQRMLRRNAPRDSGKYDRWDAYISGIDFSAPTLVTGVDVDALLSFDNTQERTAAQLMSALEEMLDIQ